MSENKYCRILLKFLLLVIISNVVINVTALRGNERVPSWEWGSGPLVKRGERKSVVSTENGEVSSVRIADGVTGSYQLQFITLEPNSLFLPVVLHADMVFYVHTGSGRLTWMGEDELKSEDLRIGDVFRLPFGTIFFLESNLEPARQKLRVYSIFDNSGDDLREPLSTGPYSSIRDIILGFDRKVLQAAFNVHESVIDEVLNGTEVPAIIHGVPKTSKKTLWEMEAQFMKSLLGRGSYGFFETQSNKKKTKLFNVFNEKPDFQNCNGWSTVITRRKLPALKGSHVGIFVVNLTKGSMMGPHWNPMATEIGIALQGEGMVRLVCSNTGTDQQCKNMRFKVEEGDVFSIPRFHPMAQMAFNNNSFVFVGFSTTAKKHHPQYLAGKASVLRTLDRQILAASLNVTNTTMDRILEAQGESVILECVSCAEEEARLMEEERRRQEEEARQREEEEAREREEERRRKEEEARKKEEEQARKAEEERRHREEEEARKRQEEEARRQEEEARRRQEEEEEARRKEKEQARKAEEERRQREEEESRKRQEEEARRREEEEARRQEEEARRRQEEEEEARRKEEEAARRREEQAQREAEEARRREEEAAARRQQEEEAARRQEEEERERQAAKEATRRQQEEEEARRRQQEEEETKRRQEEEAARRQQEEEEAQREAEEARRGEEEAVRRREEQAQREAEESRRRVEEAEARRREEEEEAQREEEQGRRRERGEGEEETEGGGGGGSEEEEAREAERRRQEEAERQEEAARRQEEEMERRHEQGREEEETEEEEQGTYEQRRRRFLTAA